MGVNWVQRAPSFLIGFNDHQGGFVGSTRILVVAWVQQALRPWFKEHPGCSLGVTSTHVVHMVQRAPWLRIGLNDHSGGSLD